MKKKLIIALVVLIVLLLGVWVYLLLNGAPASVTEFRENIFGKPAAVIPVSTPTQGEVPLEDGEGSATSRTLPIKSTLVKLTDRPVAGATFATTSEGAVVRYAVKGTGHVYDVSLTTGTENRISNRVIPQTVEVAWSPVGTRAVFTTDVGGKKGDTFLTTLTTTDAGALWLDSEKIGSLANAAFSQAGDELFYTETIENGYTRAFARNVRSGTIQTLFTVPFGENTVLWDLWKTASTSVHYVYTKPASGFNGYLYSIAGNALSKVDSAKNLSALRTDSAVVIINKDSGGGPYSLLLNTRSGRGDFLSIQTLKEKCGGYDTVVWCGTSVNAQDENFPIAWYQGTLSYADSLYKLDTRTGQSALVLDPETLAREQIDITNLTVSPEGPVIFKNKKDDSLWLFNPAQ